MAKSRLCRQDELFLQITIQIDQKVAATDQIQLEKELILDNVQLGKDQHVARQHGGATMPYTVLDLKDLHTRVSTGLVVSSLSYHFLL